LADDVGVPGEQERLLAVGRGGGEARDQVRLAGGRRRHDLDLEAERLEPRPQQLGDEHLVARRVRRVHPDEVLQERDHLTVLRAGRSGPSHEEREGARDHREPDTTLHGASLGPLPRPRLPRTGVNRTSVPGARCVRDAPAPQ
jgi:hypothetical protein